MIQLSVVPSQNLVRGQFSLIEDVGSSPDTAEEKVREAVVAIRKVFTNKKWCKWADEWLSGAGRTAASAESVAKEMARHAPKATAADRLSSRGAMLKSPAGKAALAAAIVARSASDEIDPFTSMMLEEYLKNDHPVGQEEQERTELRIEEAAPHAGQRRDDDVPARG